MKDKISIERISKLHPKVRSTFTNFIKDAELGLNITLRVTQGLRTIDEQNALYEQGRTKPGNIVTNAKGGSSYHNYGLAIDVVEMIDGKPNWNFDYKKLKPYADKWGIVWGGTFKSIIDKPHFEISFGFKPSQLKNMRIENNYVVL
jgi:LAS superfamily LD-carboxypeptidase LdcB